MHNEDVTLWLVSMQAAVIQIARRITGNLDLAREVFSELLLEFVSGRLRLAELPAQERAPFLMQSAKYVSIKQLRLNKTRPKPLDADVLELLADDIEAAFNEYETRLGALQHCLQELNPSQAESLRQRYGFGKSVPELQRAGDLRKDSAIYEEHDRLRERLLKCVTRRLQAEAERIHS